MVTCCCPSSCRPVVRCAAPSVVPSFFSISAFSFCSASLRLPSLGPTFVFPLGSALSRGCSAFSSGACAASTGCGNKSVCKSENLSISACIPCVSAAITTWPLQTAGRSNAKQNFANRFEALSRNFPTSSGCPGQITKSNKKRDLGQYPARASIAKASRCFGRLLSDKIQSYGSRPFSQAPNSLLRHRL